MTPHRRREVLGLLAGGTAALAGCSYLQGDDSGPTVDRATLREVTAGDVPQPEPVVVVDTGGRLADRHRDRIETLLDEVPTPLSADDVPNAAVRAELTDAVGYTREQLTSASEATQREDRLWRLRSARGDAGFAAWAWRAIDEDATVEDVGATADELRDDLATAERDREYVGRDPVRALLAHASIEERFESATRRLDGERRPRSSGAVGVGDLGSTVEEARANLDGASLLYDAYTESLDDATSQRDRFEAAGERLREAAERRRPEEIADWNRDPNALVEPDIEGTPAAGALEELAYTFEEQLGWSSDDPNRLASSVLGGHEFLLRAAGFGTLRDRIESGDSWRVESGDDVRQLRADAVDAIRVALDTSPGERLTRRELVQDAGTVAYVDEDLRSTIEHADEPVGIADLSLELADYLTVQHTAAATPAASETVVTALRD